MDVWDRGAAARARRFVFMLVAVQVGCRGVCVAAGSWPEVVLGLRARRCQVCSEVVFGGLFCVVFLVWIFCFGDLPPARKMMDSSRKTAKVRFFV